MRDLSLLLELYKHYYVTNDILNKYGIFYILHKMYMETDINCYEYLRLRRFFEPKFSLNELQIQDNINWLQTKINLLHEA